MGATDSLRLPAFLLSASGLSFVAAVAPCATFNLRRGFVSTLSSLAAAASASWLANCYFHPIGKPVEIIRHQHRLRLQSFNRRCIAIRHFHHHGIS